MEYPRNKLAIRRKMAALLIVSVATATGITSADDGSERENLARISYELTQVQRMVSDAGAAAESGGRTRFRYDLLARDIGLIQAGIDDHLQRPQQPRRVQPLVGDYRN